VGQLEPGSVQMEVGMKHDDGRGCTGTFSDPRKPGVRGNKTVNKFIKIGMELNPALR